MPILDDVLDHLPTNAPLHPQVRHWATLIDQGATVRLEVFRPTITLGLAQSEMTLQISNNGHRQAAETVLWDDDFNAGLIQLRVPAVDTANEVERFALGLRAALRKAERDFGDGFFNSVLFDLVNESGLAQNTEIADMLKHAYVVQPNREGARYNLCREVIAAAISGRKYELEKFLGYVPTEARKILVGALAKYLDERFSVSNRRRLGLL